MIALLVFAGGAVGAVTRYAADRAISVRHDMLFPWGTFVVNVLGSLVLGFLVGVGSHLAPWQSALLGAGFCGALTTFSTFSYETVRLLEDGSTLEAATNVVVSLVVAFGATAGGYALGALAG